MSKVIVLTDEQHELLKLIFEAISEDLYCFEIWAGLGPDEGPLLEAIGIAIAGPQPSVTLPVEEAVALAECSTFNEGDIPLPDIARLALSAIGRIRAAQEETDGGDNV